MSDAQLGQLRRHLQTIHARFKKLYDPAADERFAMEIEFKITSENVLAIKQARPWVFRPLNEPPEFPSTETGVRQVAEGTPLDTEIGVPVAATDAEGDVLTYALSGPDAGSFLIVPETGALMVWTDLDYETQATYSVTVEVHDGRDSKGQPNTSRDDWVTVSILLTNEDEVGTLTLSSEQPYPGTPLAATLTDPDGSIAGSSWVWHRSENGTGAWAIIEGAIAASYRPTATDVGNYLRATASYTDGHGSSKAVSGVSANPVEDRVPPPPPTPTPTPTPTPSVNSRGGGGGGFGPAPVAPAFVDGFRTVRTVAENARPGDAVGDPVWATHPDELEIAYSLSGTDTASFAVDEESGQLRMKEGMDLAIGRSYTVNLTATDSAGFGAIIIVTIEVSEASFSRYDLNGNNKIERDEVIRAVSDYFNATIEKDEVIELIKLYFQGDG